MLLSSSDIFFLFCSQIWNIVCKSNNKKTMGKM
jgi:hypothetical protein